MADHVVSAADVKKILQQFIKNVFSYSPAYYLHKSDSMYIQ